MRHLGTFLRRKRCRGQGCFRHRGFTMLELLVVVALIIVITAIAVPNMTTHSRNYRLRNDCNNIANLITLARMRAAADFGRSQINCDAAARNCSFQTFQYTASGTSSAVSEPQQMFLSSGVNFSTVGLPGGAGGQSGGVAAQGAPGQNNPFYVIFNSRGMPIDSNGALVTNYAFYLLDEPNNLIMAVAPDINGRPLIYDMSSGSWTVVQE